MSCNDFAQKHELKNSATSDVEIDRVPFFIGFDNVGINLRNGPF